MEQVSSEFARLLTEETNGLITVEHAESGDPEVGPGTQRGIENSERAAPG